MDPAEVPDNTLNGHGESAGNKSATAFSTPT
jgi:hypothetical protein